MFCRPTAFLFFLLAAICQAQTSVLSTGAKGDGTTDDTAAIEKAILTHGSVSFPKGTYRLTRTISIPMSDVSKFKVIVARQIDDKPIPVREKGPLFVVYPFDSAAELRTSTYYERSIWQLKALDIQ